MKSVALFIFSLISYNALSARTDTLPFKEPFLIVKRVELRVPLSTSLASLSSKLLNPRRVGTDGEAALKKEIDALESPIWVENERPGLKSSNGQRRL